MKKLPLTITVVLIFGTFCLHGRDTVSNGHALNFPAKKYGISIGNSYEFSGLRMNFADGDVKVVNGLNITLWAKSHQNMDAIVNGVSVGIIPTGGTMRLINLGVIGVGASGNLTGLNIGGAVLGLGGSLRGISASGLYTTADRIAGISVSGVANASREARGLIVGGLLVHSSELICGATMGLGCIYSNRIQGVAVSAGYMKSEDFVGGSLAAYSNTTKYKGISLALVNRTRELHGVQFGLINIAENNPAWCRVLPFVNLHLRE
ncbi:MAG: hypothetical protein WD578_06955 [Bacteroidales bacterium]